MRLKLDTAGNVVTKEGKPLYVKGDGSEVAFDAADAMARVEQADTAAKVARVFARSKFVAENLSIPFEMAEANFGAAFRQERGALVAFDGDGNKLYSRRRPGEVADPEEAIELLVSRYPHKAAITKPPEVPKVTSAHGGNVVPRAVFERMNPQQRMDHIKAGGTVSA